LSSRDCEILLFGRLKKTTTYKSNVFVKGYKSGQIAKGMYLLYYSVLLFVFKNSDKRKLDSILKAESRNSMYDRVKCYPILWNQPDIFHIQWAKGIAEWAWVKKFGIKLVLSLRGAHINYSPIADTELASMYKKEFPNVDAFHAVSKAIAEEAKKYGAKKEKIKVVYSGLDVNIFNRTKPELSNERNKFNVISVGRPHWVKGYNYALNAFKLLKDQNFQFTYTIVGGADLELKYQMAELGLENDIILIEHLPYNEVQRLIKVSDLLLLSSVKEGVANVVLEAMVAQKLVLTTNCGGMEEVIIDSVNGFLIPIRNAEAMAKKINMISQISEAQKHKITAAALETIQKQHTKELMISGMFDLYQNL
jgi:colanic acid/amylovoran biosynthesis glycosyltransferase